jgi:hypothetical protein
LGIGMNLEFLDPCGKKRTKRFDTPNDGT